MKHKKNFFDFDKQFLTNFLLKNF